MFSAEKRTAALSSNSWHLFRQSGAAANWTNVFSTSVLAAGLVVSYSCLANSSNCTISYNNPKTTQAVKNTSKQSKCYSVTESIAVSELVGFYIIIYTLCIR